MHSRAITMAVFALFLSVLSASADQNQFKKALQDLDNQFSKSNHYDNKQEQNFDEFRQTQETAFQAFRDKRDKDFSAFLKTEWKAFAEMQGLVHYTTPKPKVIPKAGDKPDGDSIIPKGKRVEPIEPLSKKPHETLTHPSAIPATDPAPKVELELIEPNPRTATDQSLTSTSPEPQPVPRDAHIPTPKSESGTESQTQLNGTAVSVMFYGLPLKVSYDPALTKTVTRQVSNDAISNYWAALSRSDHEGLVRRLGHIKGELRLNDWGFFQFVNSFARTIQTDANSATLLTWFILTKSGYRVKVGYNRNDIYLLAPAQCTIFEAPYYTVNGTRFYNISYLANQRKPGQIYTFKKDYPGAERVMTLQLRTTPMTLAGKNVRKLKFRYNGRTYTVPAVYNPNTVHFFQSYPQTNWEIYLSAHIAPETETSLISALGKIVEGKRETEAANMLLRFVQTAFKYKTDDDQFGYEKYMFAEETLSFPYSDCEDRATLFSSLVRRILNLDVIGLHFPGHVATAVRFSEYVPGDAVKVNGKRYVVCDPTYINANIGMTMPQFKRVRPEVIRGDL
jgi:hypothetical protein